MTPLGRRAIPPWPVVVLALGLLLLAGSAPVGAGPAGPGRSDRPAEPSRIAQRGSTPPALRDVEFILNATPDTDVSLSAEVSASIGVSSGVLDQNESVPAVAELSVPGTETVKLDVLGYPVNLSIPALGFSAPAKIPGSNFTYDGVPVELTYSTEGSIRANASDINGSCPTVGNGSGCAVPLIWTSSGNRTLGVQAANSTPAGTVIAARLYPMRYSLSIAINATAHVPLLGNVTYKLLPLTQLANFSSTPAYVEGSFTVVASPSIPSIELVPSSPAVGAPMVLTAGLTGGIAPFVLSWAGLPPGCSSANATIVSCSPASAGTYAVSVTATDSQGEKAIGHRSVVVSGGPSAGTSSSAQPGSTAILEGLAAAAVALLAAILVVILRRRPPAR